MFLNEISGIPVYFKILLYLSFIIVLICPIFFMTLNQTGTNIYIHIFVYIFGLIIGFLSHCNKFGLDW
jgi:hypothetical protein